MSEPSSWKVGKLGISPLDVDLYDGDPRGILWVWEEPRPSATYVLGVDPTVGKTGWNRWARVDEDAQIDNAVIEVLRAGTPDVQVAEFAAPIDAVELAPIVNALGHLYAGSNEDGEAHTIVEATGPGAVTIGELTRRFNYSNLFMWRRYGQAGAPIAARSIGWFSSRSSNKDLWMRGLHHIHKGRLRVNSPFIVEEMCDCVADTYSVIGEARRGWHDDRVFATLFAIWASHGWSLGESEEQERATVDNVGGPNWQATDLTAEELEDAWNDRMDHLLRD